jgi:hypothetical protein
LPLQSRRVSFFPEQNELCYGLIKARKFKWKRNLKEICCKLEVLWCSCWVLSIINVKKFRLHLINNLFRRISDMYSREQ